MNKIIILVAVLIVSLVTNLLGQSKLEKHFFRGEYPEAIALYQKLAGEGKADVDDYWLAAKCYEQQFDFTTAVNCYRQALALDSLNFKSLEGLADALSQLGSKREAVGIYAKLYASDTLDNRIAGKYAALLADVNSYRLAETLYQKLANADSTNIFYKRKLVGVIYKQENFLKTILAAVDYLDFQPADNEIRLVLATAYQQLDSVIPAIDQSMAVLAVDSTNILALSKIAYLYFSKLKEYDQAGVCYQQLNLLETNSDPFHLTNWGICEFFTGSSDVAAPLLDSLSDVLPTDPMIPFYAGLSYKELGEIDLGLQFLERSAFLVIPAYAADVFHHLGRAYRDKRMFAEALKAFGKVREIDPDNFMVLYDIALTHEEYNLNRKEAFTYYEQFLNKCANKESAEAKYARSRMDKIKEQLFFEGK